MKKEFEKTNVSSQVIQDIAKRANHSEEYSRKNLEMMKENLEFIKSSLDSANNSKGVNFEDIQMAPNSGLSDVTINDAHKKVK